MDPENASSSGNRIRQVRVLLWALVAVTIAGVAVLMSLPKAPNDTPTLVENSGGPGIGGPFTLVGGDGKPFASSRLAGKPYAIYFGFTRCGDVCPTTLGRLVKLRGEAGGESALNIMFVTIDPTHDGPKEVGQYAALFNSPIIGLTGTQAQIDHIKKQYKIFAEPSPHPMAGKEMEHTASVLLFDRGGNFVSTIDSQEPDSTAVAKLKRLTV